MPVVLILVYQINSWPEMRVRCQADARSTSRAWTEELGAGTQRHIERLGMTSGTHSSSLRNPVLVVILVYPCSDSSDLDFWSYRFYKPFDLTITGKLDARAFHKYYAGVKFASQKNSTSSQLLQIPRPELLLVIDPDKSALHMLRNSVFSVRPGSHPIPPASKGRATMLVYGSTFAARSQPVCSACVPSTKIVPFLHSLGACCTLERTLS